MNKSKNKNTMTRYMVNFELHDNDANSINRRVITKKPKGIKAKLIEWGLAKNETQATIILLLLIIISFAIIIYQQIDFSSNTITEQIDMPL